MIKQLFVALCLISVPMHAAFVEDVAVPAAAAPAAADEQAILEDAVDAFQDLVKYLQTEAKPEASQVDLLLVKVQSETAKVYKNTATSEKARQMAYQYAMVAYVVTLTVDRTKYEPAFRTLAAECVKDFPGSEIASIGDSFVLQLDLISATQVDALKKIEGYAKTYPKSAMGPQIAMAYIINMIGDDYTAAKNFTEESLKIFPANDALVQHLAALERIGKAISLTGPTIDSKTFNLSDWKGKVVVVDFWATWCKPCTKLTPDLVKLYEDLNAKGVEFVGVSLDKTQKDVEDYVAANKMAWTHVFAAKASERAALANGFGVTGIPALFVIGKDGNLASAALHSLKAVERIVEKELKK